MFKNYPITFQDPATVIAYNLFSVHHDVFFFIIIILSLVYWSLYKIIKDFNWHISTKQVGLLRILFTNPNFIKIESWFLKQWFNIFSSLLIIWGQFIDNFTHLLLARSMRLRWVKILLVYFEDDYYHGQDIRKSFINEKIKLLREINYIYWIVAPVFRKGSYFPDWLLSTSKVHNNIEKQYSEFVIEKYLSYFVYNYTSNSRFFHDIKDDFLATQRLNIVLI